MSREYAVSIIDINDKSFNKIALKIMNRNRWKIANSFLSKNELLIIVWQRRQFKWKK